MPWGHEAGIITEDGLTTLNHQKTMPLLKIGSTKGSEKLKLTLKTKNLSSYLFRRILTMDFKNNLSLAKFRALEQDIRSEFSMETETGTLSACARLCKRRKRFLINNAWSSAFDEVNRVIFRVHKCASYIIRYCSVYNLWHLLDTFVVG